jgi:hypothetical protein
VASAQFIKIKETHVKAPFGNITAKVPDSAIFTISVWELIY